MEAWRWPQSKSAWPGLMRCRYSPHAGMEGFALANTV